MFSRWPSAYVFIYFSNNRLEQSELFPHDTGCHCPFYLGHYSKWVLD